MRRLEGSSLLWLLTVYFRKRACVNLSIEMKFGIHFHSCKSFPFTLQMYNFLVIIDQSMQFIVQVSDFAIASDTVDS